MDTLRDVKNSNVKELDLKDAVRERNTEIQTHKPSTEESAQLGENDTPCGPKIFNGGRRPKGL